MRLIGDSTNNVLVGSNTRSCLAFGLMLLLSPCIFVLIKNGDIVSQYNNLHSGANTIQSRLEKTTSKNVTIDALKMLARHSHQLACKYAKFGLHEISPNDDTEHYELSRFQISPGRNAVVTFDVANALNSSHRLVGKETVGNDNCIGRVICKIERPFAFGHFPHFSQYFFPCFSGVLHAMEVLNEEPKINQSTQIITTNGTQFVIELLGGVKLPTKPMWIADMAEYIKRTGILIQERGRATYSKCDWIVEAKQNPQGSSGWQAEMNKVDPRSKGATMKRYPLNNPVYFGNQRHVEFLQRAVLGDNVFQSGPSQEIPIRVLIVDRALQTRHWMYSNQTKDLLESEWSTMIDLKIVNNPDGDLHNQALLFHSADIIISPHGAQLANLAFIRPCTAVVELFPVGYYLSFFQPYVLAAGGISFKGYPFDSPSLVDTQKATVDGHVRGASRSGPILASQESLAHQFPTVVSDVISCRENWQM